MSHVPGGLVYKRWLNALRGPGVGGGPVPPAGLFVIYEGETISPVPPESVNGAALLAHLSFQGRCIGVAADGFETKTDGLPMNGESVLSGGNSAIISCDAGNAFSEFAFLGRFNTTTGGTIFGNVSPLTPLTFTFGANLAGFGIYFTDMGDFGAQWTATLTDQFDNVTNYDIGHTVGSPEGSLMFWGFIDSTGLLYKSVTFTSSNTADGIGIDDAFLVAAGQITG